MMKTILILLALTLAPGPAFANSAHVYKKNLGGVWPFTFSSGTLYCKNLGNGRKAVWINGSDGYTYAINGQAMAWFDRANLKDAEGNPHRKARDYTDRDLMPLIQKGLYLCD